MGVTRPPLGDLPCLPAGIAGPASPWCRQRSGGCDSACRIRSRMASVRYSGPRHAMRRDGMSTRRCVWASTLASLSSFSEPATRRRLLAASGSASTLGVSSTTPSVSATLSILLLTSMGFQVFLSHRRLCTFAFAGFFVSKSI